MRVTIQSDLKPTVAQLEQFTEKGQYVFINQVLTDMNRYVPMLSSDLRQTGSLGVDGKSVVWNTPYARAQFYGTNGRATFNNYTTPGTGKRWDLIAASRHQVSWVRVIKGAMTL